jgi:hypothetical protein
MTRLAGTVDGVIGVDPHRDTLAAAVTDSVGGLLAQTSVSADTVGYQRLLAFARAQVPGPRSWAVEGAGSYGPRLAALLQAHGEQVVEVGRSTQATPAARRRQERRSGCFAGGPGRAGLRLSPGAASSWRPGGAAGAAGHPSQRLCGQGRRHQPAGRCCMWRREA